MEISANSVKELRDKTGAGMMDCKNALQESQGDFTKAIEILRKKGLSAAAKKIGRQASEGVVSSYIHAGGKIGVLVEVNCETDFVARNEHFQSFVKDIAMHIAASNPSYIRIDEVPQVVLEKEKEIYKAQLKEDPKMVNKPPPVLEKIVEGRLQKFYEESCLLKQTFIKDPTKTIEILTSEMIAKIGENIQIRRFMRFQVGAT